jgi:phospholipid/cholesterol/gamma-HCH transport system substrate-binding protein
MGFSREVKVGAFVLIGLVLFGFVIFLIGDERRLFDSKVTYRATFSDVQGLKTGAPIRMGGVDIGTVGKVAHGDNPSDNRLYVELHVVKSESVRVHTDSVARVANKGLLGDKMIELTAGNPGTAPTPAGGELKSDEPSDVFSQIGPMTEHVQAILTNLESTSKALADAQMHEDVRSSMHSISIVLKNVAEGNGYVHKLFTDENEAARVSKLLVDLDRLAGDLHETASSTQVAIDRINRGPGFAHDVIYGDKGNEAIGRFGEAASELATTLRGIREGSGLAHSVIYGGDGHSEALAANLDATTADIRQMVADLRAGKGTLGALLVDPSIYEDMKAVLGNVERNDVLRALVRYSIKQDEKRPDLRGPSPSPAAPATAHGPSGGTARGSASAGAP